MDDWKKTLEEERRRSRERRGIPDADFSPTPTDVLVGELRASAAEPFVEQIRSDFFGSPAPPFTSVADAAVWIENVASPAGPESKASGLRVLIEKHGTELERVARKAHLRFSPEVSAVLLPYLRSNKSEAVIFRKLKSEFWPIADAVKTIADATGFGPARVTLWILTGERPPLFRLHTEVKLVPGPPAADGTLLPGRRVVTLTLEAPLEEQEFRRLWRWTRRAFRSPSALDSHSDPSKRSKTITLADTNLWELVEKMPLGDHSWEERAQAYSALHGSASPDALRVRWARLRKKLTSMEVDDAKES